MKKFFDNAKTKASAIGAGIVVGATNAMATPTLTIPTFDTDPVILIGSALLGGIAIIWGVKKAIGVPRA